MFKQLVTCGVPNVFPRFYLYKLIFKSVKTYIGQHTQRKEDDNYITSSAYYFHSEKTKSDELVMREIFLFVKDKQTLDIMETICIMSDKAYNNKMNTNGNLGSYLSKSVVAGWNRGLKMSDEFRKNHPSRLKGIPLSEEHKKKISQALKGKKQRKRKPLSEEHKKKLSEIGKSHPSWNSKKNKNYDEEKVKLWAKKHSEAMKGKSPPNKGKKMTEEQRIKNSKGHKGQTAWNKGLKMSDDFKEKCRNRQVGKPAKNKGERGRKCWNNGERNIMVFDNPGDGWVLGKLKK